MTTYVRACVPSGGCSLSLATWSCPSRLKSSVDGRRPVGTLADRACVPSEYWRDGQHALRRPLDRDPAIAGRRSQDSLDYSAIPIRPSRRSTLPPTHGLRPCRPSPDGAGMTPSEHTTGRTSGG
jgi:hypothetical protein